VGASGWDYRAPYAGSVEATLIAVQEQVLTSGDYIWPWDDIDPEDLGEDEGAPRPSSLAELAAAKEIEEFWDEGTHAILDIDRVVAADDNQVGAIVPLSSVRCSAPNSRLRPTSTAGTRQAWWVRFISATCWVRDGAAGAW
jgi:hypothetical protein